MSKDQVLTASANARQLARRERQSGNLPEVLIWRELRKRPGGYKFRRQHPLSEVVLDFACLEARLAIEVDGAAHDLGDRPQRDVRRDAYLESRGFSVLRLPVKYVLQNVEGAIISIVAACDERLPLRIGSADRPLRTGEVLGSGAKPTSLRYGETGMQGKPERPL
jgi:very-short-patch-repair endonuclease